MNKIIVFLLMILICFSSLSFAVEGKDSQEKSNFNWGGLIFAIICLGLLIGLVAYFTSPQFAILKENGMGAAMKDPEIRLVIMEHPLMMILAVVLITVGFSKHKNKSTDKAKFKTIALYYGVALLFVLSRIPWAKWFN